MESDSLYCGKCGQLLNVDDICCPVCGAPRGEGKGQTVDLDAIPVIVEVSDAALSKDDLVCLLQRQYAIFSTHASLYEILAKCVMAAKKKRLFGLVKTDEEKRLKENDEYQQTMAKLVAFFNNLSEKVLPFEYSNPQTIATLIQIASSAGGNCSVRSIINAYHRFIADQEANDIRNAAQTRERCLYRNLALYAASQAIRPTRYVVR